MIIGIDLGTTNSVVAVWRDGASHLIPNSLGEVLTPSAVSIGDDGAILVGAAARERQSTHPLLTATSFKRLMGTQSKAKLGKREFLPEELSAFVLRNLKADAEAFLGEEVTEAVITVPAYFNDRQRKATRRAGALAGLNVNRLLNEPTAAALAYGIQDRGEKEPFLVFDLGGGTFDVSIVEIFSGIVEVRASAGDSRLGGDDFNRCLVDLLRPRLEAKQPLKGNALVIDALLNAAAERARRALSQDDSASFSIVVNDQAHATTVTAAEFEQAAAGLLAKLRDPVLRSLRDSEIRVENLSDIVLVGGATRMPVVRQAITRMFGRFPNNAVHPDHAIGIGAAIQAGLLARDAALEEIRLTDVCPFTLGVDMVEQNARGGYRHGIFSPIIERNTPIPASRSASYCTIQDNQRELQFSVYQGEAREVANNVKLGSIRVPVPPRPAGQVEVECRFSYDTSGLLEVDVTVPASGITRSLTILEGADDLSPTELAARRDALSALKVHPRDDDRNIAVVARAGRCYEAFIGERREVVGHFLAEFLTAVDGQDPAAIERARELLSSRLDSIENDALL